MIDDQTNMIILIKFETKDLLTDNMRIDSIYDEEIRINKNNVRKVKQKYIKENSVAWESRR